MAAKKYYAKSKIMRDHELQLALINAFARDPELKYYVGMAAGAGVAWVGKMLDIYMPEADNTTPANGAEAAAKEAVSGMSYGWMAASGMLPYLVLKDSLGKLSWNGGTSDTSAGGLAGQMGNILMLGGTGFAGTCAMILVLRAIFSGTDLGELLSGVGEIIPL